jgi:anti-sigma regulatory factor (Ser/Thr protein kinase)
MDFTADVRHVGPSRAALRSWLTQAGVEQEQIQDMLVAAGEAVVDGLQVSVIDTGVWKTPRQVVGENRGRGISLMRCLVQDLSIHSNDGGTTVHSYARIT